MIERRLQTAVSSARRRGCQEFGLRVQSRDLRQWGENVPVSNLTARQIRRHLMGRSSQVAERGMSPKSSGSTFLSLSCFFLLFLVSWPQLWVAPWSMPGDVSENGRELPGVVGWDPGPWNCPFTSETLGARTIRRASTDRSPHGC